MQIVIHWFTRINLLVDGTIFIGFLVAMAPRFSGLAVHEWLGIAFAAAIVTHLLLHWDWIVSVTARIFNKALQQKQRINYALNNSFGFGGTNAALLLKRYTP